ncbi:MAG: UPF0179 family protein [Promethearchaeota archaeon]
MKSKGTSKTSKTSKKSYIVTLALEANARKGSEFFHEKVPVTCKSCKLSQICMGNLEIGREYRIMEVNEMIRHPCPLYGKDLLVVKVMEKPLIVSFPGRKCFAGVMIKFHPTPCPEKSCVYYGNCNPPPSIIPKGMPVLVKKILKKIKSECKFNHDLSLFEVQKKRH